MTRHVATLRHSYSRCKPALLEFYHFDIQNTGHMSQWRGVYAWCTCSSVHVRVREYLGVMFVCVFVRAWVYVQVCLYLVPCTGKYPVWCST